jgi:excisionase family DNA binding protein
MSSTHTVAKRRADPPPNRRRWVTVEWTANYLGVTTKTVRSMISEGRLTGYRNGRFIRLDLDEIDAAMQPFGGGA